MEIVLCDDAVDVVLVADLGHDRKMVLGTDHGGHTIAWKLTCNRVTQNRNGADALEWFFRMARNRVSPMEVR